MLWQTTVITLADPAAAGPAATARIERALGNASTDSVGTDGAIQAWVRPSLPGTVRGGHLIRRLGFPDEAAWRRWLGSPAYERSATVLDGAEVLAHTTATYDDGRVGARRLAGANPVYRALLLRAEPPGLASSVTGALPEPPGTPAGPDVLERFEDELFAMGEAIPVMRQWRLARVIATGGFRRRRAVDACVGAGLPRAGGPARGLHAPSVPLGGGRPVVRRGVARSHRHRRFLPHLLRPRPVTRAVRGRVRSRGSRRSKIIAMYMVTTNI